MIIIIPVMIALHSFAFMYLWNLLVTDIFSLRLIGFWESLGLVAMVKLLFMTGHRGKGCNSKNSSGNGHDDSSVGFKERMRDHFTSKYCCTKDSEDENTSEEK